MNLLLITSPENGIPPNQIPPKFQRMITALEQGGIHAVHRFNGTAQEIKEMLEEVQPQVVFSTPYYTIGDVRGRKNIHGLLDSLGVPYIGSDEKSLELVISKQALKRHWIAAGVSTPSSAALRLNKDMHFWGLEQLDRLTRFPYILKPNREGNSRGIDTSCVVRDREHLQSVARGLFEKYDEILVERYLGDFPDVREFTVAMIGGDGHMLMMPSEIILKEKRIPRLITTRDKEEHKTKAVPVRDPVEKDWLSGFAHKAFVVAGVQDYARCDLLFAEKTLFAIEINGLPMVPDLWFQQCAAGVGMDETQYLNAISLAGLVRNLRQGKLHSTIPSQLKKIIPSEIFQELFQGVD